MFFFLAVFGIVAVTMWRRLMVERERQQTIRLAIERGQTLDAALVEKLLAPPPTRAPANPYTWPVGITSTGLGLGAFSLFIRQIAADAFWPIMGAACLVATIGLGLLFNAYLRPRLTGNSSYGSGG
jgi:hypothetical protein